MFIKRISKKNIFSFSLITKIYFFLTIILFSLALPVFFNTGLWLKNQQDILNRIYFNGINHYPKIFEILFEGSKKFTHDYKKISLNIPYDNLLIIEKNRGELIKNAIQDGSARRQNDEFKVTEAKLIFEEEEFDVKIRLKGDRTIHFREKDKSSYKITVRGEKRLDGMKKFSFIKPRTRNYIHEWLYHELASTGELVKLNYEFFYLYVNGSNQGLYVIEEGFGKELIERNKRRNGPIFSLYEEFDRSVFETKLEVFNKNYWYRKENLQVLDFAKKKFQNFIEGKSSLDETFDLEKWAWYFATLDLTYTYHGMYPDQVKLYYNPISGLFEPVPFDGHRTLRNYSKYLKEFDESNAFEIATACLDEINGKHQYSDYKCPREVESNAWEFSFFYNSDLSLNVDFYEAYVNAIRRITDKNFLNSFFEKRKKNIEKINSAIYSDYFFIDNATYDKYGPGFYYFSKEDTFYRAKILRDKIQIQQSKIFVTDDLNNIIVENKNPINHQLKVSKIYCEQLDLSNPNNIEYETEKYLNFYGKTVIQKEGDLLKNTRCQFLELVDKNKDKYLKKIIFSPDISLSEKNLKKENFLKYFNKNEKELTLKEKQMIISENVFIPKNYIVKINSGEKIILLDNAFIYSMSSWEAGDQNGKVEISGDKNNFGGGIFISQSQSESKFINTDFSYLSGLSNKHYFDEKYKNSFEIMTTYPDQKKNNFMHKKINFKKKGEYNFIDGRILFGALNFYNTKVKIENCRFFRIDSEDAINFMSTNYLIDGVTFEENSFDAIDVDFGSGIIKNSYFNFIGNDGVDLSGTSSELKNLQFKNIEDKIISVGENSEVKISKIRGQNSFLGIASKDGSKTYLDDAEFLNVKIPFASYIKKKAYSPGFMEVSNISKLENYLVKAIRDESSEIIIDGINNKNISSKILDIVIEKKVNLLNE